METRKKIETAFKVKVDEWIEYIESIIETLKDLRSKNCLNCDDYNQCIKKFINNGVGGLGLYGNCEGCIRTPKPELLHFLYGSDYYKKSKHF